MVVINIICPSTFPLTLMVIIWNGNSPGLRMSQSPLASALASSKAVLANGSDGDYLVGKVDDAVLLYIILNLLIY